MANREFSQACLSGSLNPAWVISQPCLSDSLNLDCLICSPLVVWFAYCLIFSLLVIWFSKLFLSCLISSALLFWFFQPYLLVSFPSPGWKEPSISPSPPISSQLLSTSFAIHARTHILAEIELVECCIFLLEGIIYFYLLLSIFIYFYLLLSTFI